MEHLISGPPERPGVAALAEQVRSGSVSATEVIQQALARAESDQWNCIDHVFRVRAMEQARLLDKRIAAGDRNLPLAGLPYVAKASFDIAGEPTTAGRVAPQGLPAATRDAALVRWLTAAGAIVIATAHMDELALGFLGRNSPAGPTINPRDHRQATGGSSSGSAAAVSAGIVPLALGTDTNGSVRVPAALCGIYAIKPTRSAWSLKGVSPLAPSLDCAGLFAASLKDLRHGYAALAGSDDRFWSKSATDRVGLVGGDYDRLTAPATLHRFRTFRKYLPNTLALKLSHIETAFAAAAIITAYEASKSYEGEMKGNSHLFSEAVAIRLACGLDISPEAYRQARKWQSRIAAELLEILRQVRVLVLPVIPVDQLLIDQEWVELDGPHVSASDAAGLYTRPFSLAGFPVLVVPGRGREPLSCPVQLVGRPGDEPYLFALASQIETLKSDR
ncbi:MAG: amidase family protein [Pseudomonadota bacterium]